MQHLANSAVKLALDALEFVAVAKLKALQKHLKAARLVLIAADRTVGCSEESPCVKAKASKHACVLGLENKTLAETNPWAFAYRFGLCCLLKLTQTNTKI